MAKKTAKPAAPTTIDVRYDLLDLPSAQHKAGLAGLLLQIENMRERQEKEQLLPDREIPKVVEQTATTAVIRFTERSAQDLFDDLYNANPKERWTYKWPKEKKGRPTREVPEEVTDARGRKSTKIRLYYDDAEPFSFFLDNFMQGDKEPWHKLWRDMIYAVPRNKPTTRQAYKSRADDQPTREGIEAWKALLAGEKAKAKGTRATVELAGSLMLAVQAVTAEAVPFEDRVETQLLLHFWVLTARVFVPQCVDADGKSEFVGYALAVPEVGDLKKFCKRYKELLDKLDIKKNLFRPAGAVIALPEQGPLEFLHNLDRLTAEKALAEPPADYVTGVEFFHMVVAGNNVKLKAHGRIPVERKLIQKYGSISRDFHNPEVVAGLILALLRDRPWFTELETRLHERDWSHFVHSTQERRRTPAAMTSFAWEVDRQFRAICSLHSSQLADINEYHPLQKEAALAELAQSPDTVDRLVYRLIGQYAHHRTLARLRMDADDPKKPWLKEAKDKKGKPLKREDGKAVMWETSEYQEERRKVCSTLFLELRSRNDEDFVSHISNTLASVPQKRNLSEAEYAVFASALMTTSTDESGEYRRRTRADVKNLALLALSAHSRSLFARDETPGVDTESEEPEQ